MLKAWNFQNFIIGSKEKNFLTETRHMVTWVMTSAFFLVNFFFLKNISTYTLLEPQWNAEQSFQWNPGLKMYGNRDIGGKRHQWRHHFLGRKFFSFDTHKPIYQWNGNFMLNNFVNGTLLSKCTVTEIFRVKVDNSIVEIFLWISSTL